jgi:malonyl-CoA/methylmalonyl-CoA synthetase
MGQDMDLPAADESPVQKKSAPRSKGESRLFLETPAGIALTYEGMITLSGRYAEALAEPGLKPGDRVAAQVEKDHS